MKRLAVVAMCVLLTGCAEQSLIDDPTSPTSDVTATDTDSGSQAFVFDSGVLEIGDFDPYALGEDLFDPCAEITAEEFAAAGFDNVEPMPEEYAGLARGLSSCDVEKHDGVLSEGFGNSDASRTEIERLTEVHPRRSNIIPTLFVYSPESGQGNYCYAQVDTSRGGLVSEVAGSPLSNQETMLCDVAVSNLEALFTAFSR